VTRVEHSWAGLRTFAPDRVPVAGFDPRADGFFWLAGQGGYGVQTAPALSRIAAALISRTASTETTDDLVGKLSPERLIGE
jgi:D-arginine dehydrogenase